MEERVDERAAVARVYIPSPGRYRTRPGVDHHAGGFVDDGEVFVFVDDIERDVLGEGVERRRLWRAFDLDGLASVELLLRLGGVASDANLFVFNEELDAGAADVGDGLGEVLVEAESGGFGRGGEGADAVLRLLLVEVEGGNGGRRGWLGAARGAVLRLDGAAALAFGEHVLRRHGQQPFAVQVSG